MATSTADKKPRQRRKAKYVVLYSPFLMRETKHELVGEVIESDNGRQQWAKCTVCHHSQLINLDTLQAGDTARLQVNREDAVDYTPTSEFPIGSTIYHRTWDDVGVVKGKEIMSNGRISIVVLFEKNKEKRLVENVG